MRRIERLTGVLPEVRLPRIGKSVPVPVYVVHNSPDAEDYFFIFGFEEFVAASRSGLFVRPELVIWAGRDDFERGAFARQFREAFGREFDAARQALAAGPAKSRGWLDFDLGGGFTDFTAKVASNMLLYLATHGAKAVLGQSRFSQLFGGKSDASRLEDEISRTQTAIDAALATMEVRLQYQLIDHAWLGRPPEHLKDAGQSAWPVPDFVRKELNLG